MSSKNKNNGNEVSGNDQPVMPTVGRVVHYRTRGSADGVYPPQCRPTLPRGDAMTNNETLAEQVARVKPDEVWLPVSGYEGLYEVSDQGRVRSFDHIDPQGRLHRGRILKPTRHKRALVVSLFREGVRERRSVHQMVLMEFVGPRPEPHFHARHLDDDPLNCALVNLAWGTPSENTLDMVRNGNHPSARKTHCSRGHALIEGNLIASKDGGRRCLACKRKRWAACTEEQKARRRKADREAKKTNRAKEEVA